MAERVLMAGLMAVISAGSASAHAPPSAPAVLVIRADGRFELTVRCDFVAWLMQAEAGHAPQSMIGELKAMPEAELKQLVSDGLADFVRRTELRFDGVKATIETSTCPPGAELQKLEYSHDRTELLPVVMSGRLPPEAKILEVALPEGLGRTSLAVEWEGGAVVRQSLKAGETSWPLLLDPDAQVATPEKSVASSWGGPAFWTGFLVGAALAGISGVWLRRFGRARVKA